ncbi:MAG: hypothetical protein R3E32_19855 [Chitinophagales bacterium]
MKSSNSLFELVKSLTPAEKRYFKVFAQRHVKGEENNYVLLFNAIDKQDVYDEAQLLKKMRVQLLVRHFSSEKNYLYKLILKAMNAYDLDKSVDAKIQELIGFTTFFRKKRLYQQALKQLDKAKKLAVKYERYFYLVNILHIETTIINYSHELRNQKRLKINQIEMEAAFEKAQLYDEYKHLFDEVFWKNNKGMYATNQEQKTYFEQKLQSPLLQNPCPLSDFRTQKLYYQILQICYVQTHQAQNGYDCAQKIVDLYESQTHFMTNEMDNYISMLGNTIVSCYQLGNLEAMYQVIQKLRAVPAQTFNQEVAVFETSYNAEIAYYNQKKDYKKIEELLIGIEQKLNRYGSRIKQPSLMVWYYNMASLYFALTYYDKSLDWLNRFFDLYISGVREDTYNKAIFLNLFLHWELGNHRLLESLLRSASNYLLQKKNVYSFEKQFLSFFKKLLNLPIEAKTERMALLQSLNSDLQQIEGKVEKRFLNSTVILTWLEKQLT